MKKPKRNERLIYMTHYLTTHPNQLISLNYFGQLLQAAKSSLSEDVTLLNDTFREQQLGTIETQTGVSGGVIYRPTVNDNQRLNFIAQIEQAMHDRKRILPGNYIQLQDILQDPALTKIAAQIIVEYYQTQNVDAVMTVEAKGIGLAAMVADGLNASLVVVRRDSQATVGSTISVNYLSGSHQQITKMELSTDSLKKGDRVLIIDDFMRHGGTISGLYALLSEFRCHAVGACVLVENMTQAEREFEVDALFTVNLYYDESQRQFDLQVAAGEITKPLQARKKSSVSGNESRETL